MRKEGCRIKKMKVKDVELKINDEKWNIEWRMKVIKGGMRNEGWKKKDEKRRMRNEDNKRNGWGMRNVGWRMKIMKVKDEEWEM